MVLHIVAESGETLFLLQDHIVARLLRIEAYAHELGLVLLRDIGLLYPRVAADDGCRQHEQQEQEQDRAAEESQREIKPVEKMVVRELERGRREQARDASGT